MAGYHGSRYRLEDEELCSHAGADQGIRRGVTLGCPFGA